jgi:hypothetical protein
VSLQPYRYRMRRPPAPIALRNPAGRKRAIPKELRAQIYQLELTVIETDREIRRLLAPFGFSKEAQTMQRRRIIAERGA